MDIGYAGAPVGGVLTLLSPCSAVLLPAFFAYAFTGERAIIGRTFVFLAGLLTTLVPLGVAASTVGMFFSEHRATVVLVASVVVIGLGLLQVLGIPLPLPGRRQPTGRTGSVGAVYLLGTVYRVAGVCSGPILGSVLAVAAAGGNPWYGGTLLAIYALGMVLPVLVLSVLWQRFELGRRGWLRPRTITLGPIRTTVTSVVSGGIFIALGVLLLVTDGTANLGGVLTVDAQYRSESAVQAWSRSVPDLIVVLVLAVLVAVTAVVLNRAPRSADNGDPDRGGVPRSVVVVATVLGGSGLVAVLMGVPTDLIDTPLFSRDVPPTWWSRPVWLVTALLSGVLIATYLPWVAPRVTRAAAPRLGGVGGIVGFLAIGCPVCNKLVLIMLGASGAMTYFAPVQPFLAIASLALLVVALVVRLRPARTCPVPIRTDG